MNTTITGPVNAGKRGRPFGATPLNFESFGYVEEEYFLAGTASRYREVGDTFSRFDGHWQAEPAGEADYKTRVLIYRPANPAAFNGTVILTWNNVTAGHDLFNADSLELFEGGFGMAFLTTQKVGIVGLPPQPQGLAAWDPERYGSLHIPSDDYSFDIFTQAAQAIRAADSTTPDLMGGLGVKHVVAQGASQSAYRLSTYVNAIQPLTRALDGCILSIYFARRTSLEVGEEVVNINAVQDASPRDRLMGQVQVRDDLGIPIFAVNSEMEAISCYAVRQPDTDTFRYWEAAGTCHVSQQSQAARALQMQRDGIVSRPARDGINAIPMSYLYDAAFHHMHRWLEEGVAPPIQPLIEFAGDPPDIVRDEYGIAKGGIRLPQVEVPVAQNSAIPLTEDIFGILDGSCHPFPADQIRRLYGDRSNYLARFEAAAQQAVAAGVLMPRDVEPLLQEAAGHWPED